MCMVCYDEQVYTDDYVLLTTLNPSTPATIHSLALHWCFRSTYGSTIPKSLGIRNGLFLHNHRTALIAMSPSPRGSLNLITTAFEDLSSAIESANNGTSTDAGEIKTNFATIDDQHPKTQLRCGGLQGKTYCVLLCTNCIDW